MKKIFDKKSIFSFVLGIILCSGVVYGTNIYESNTIEYSPTDETWEVSNVNEAINSLYSIKKNLDTTKTELNNTKTTLNNLKGIGDATAAQILSGKKAVVKGSTVTGSMTNRGAVTSTLNAGGSYTIPAGYHNGSGKITANSLASQTSATATAADIKSGKTAWVNGTKVTGTSTIDYSQIFAFETLSKTSWSDASTYTGTCGTLKGVANGATFTATIDCTILAHFSMTYTGALQSSYITASSGCEIIQKKVDTNNKREYVIKVPKGKTVTMFAGAFDYTSYSMGVMCSKIY